MGIGARNGRRIKASKNDMQEIGGGNLFLGANCERDDSGLTDWLAARYGGECSPRNRARSKTQQE